MSREGIFITDDFEDSRRIEFMKALATAGFSVYHRRLKCQKPDERLDIFASKLQDRMAPNVTGKVTLFMLGAGYHDVANSGQVMIESKEAFISVNFQADIATIDVWAIDRVMSTAITLLEEMTSPLGPRIHWAYGKHGETMTQQLNLVPLVKGAYPWLKSSYEDYIDAFMKSSANILILIGPPGTGKTSFIRNMIARTSSQALLTYDPEIINNEQFFVSFMEGQSTFLVAEDCDTMLKSREDGNTMMHRFLNIADGLVSSSNKKLIFSTNLPTVRDIDTALIRPGRCFDVLEFRALNREEAKVVTTAHNLELKDGNQFTLAELFNQVQVTSGTVNRKMGFAP
jgi:SpoVK/Ycf46/Vps4 family AAA+-type ATPase